MVKYPKLLLLTACFVLAYILSHDGYFAFLDHINGYGYLSVFLAGLLFSFGFTSPFAIAMFVELAPQVQPVGAAVVAGAGALLMDLTIFEAVRFSTLHDELHRLGGTRLLRWMHSLLHHEELSERIRATLLWSLAGFIIASPLPDEIGVTLVSGVTNVEGRSFALLCFLFNALGVFLILLAAR